MDSFSQQLSESYTNVVEKLTAWLNAIIINLPNVVIAVAVALLAYMISGYIRKLSVKSVSKFTSNRTVLNLVSNLAAVVFGILIMFLILTIFDLGSTINKILATAGVLGLAVGLALQDPMNNLFSGIFMSVRKLYRIGDLVETNGYFGKILNIDLRATTLMSPQGQEVVIPNKEVIQNPLTNYTVYGSRRVDLECGVSYGDDLEYVEKLVLDTIGGLDDIIKDRPVEMFFTEFGDSSVNFVVRYWINETAQGKYLKYKSMGMKAIKKAFDSNDIMIPFPIRTLDFGIKGGVPMTDILKANKTAASNGANTDK